MFLLDRKEYDSEKKLVLRFGNHDCLPLQFLNNIQKKLSSRRNFSEEWFESILINFNSKENVTLRRNFPVGNRYFADYLWPEMKIIIEIDDASHDLKLKKDLSRTKHLEAIGYKLCRIKYKNLPGALKVLERVFGIGNCHVVVDKGLCPQKRKYKSKTHLVLKPKAPEVILRKKIT